MIQTLSLHEILFAGPVNDITRRPRSFWSNRIVLPEINILDELKLDETKLSSTRVTISLRGRNLNGVVLVSARLPKADFTGASLREANLSGADLREAVFECGGYRRCVDLRGASLHGAKLQGADLLDAQLQGSDLNGAILQGAVLGGANLFGSELWFAHLQGAFLMRANLQGLYLGNAYLEGAIFSETQLQGAVLESANLKAAFLDKTQLQGAFFVKSFGDVTGPQFEGAFLDHVFVWRTDPTLGRFDNTLIRLPNSAAEYAGVDCPYVDGSCPWSADNYLALLQSAVSIERQYFYDFWSLGRLDPNSEDDNWRQSWEAAASRSPALADYEKLFSEKLKGVGCDEAGAPYVARGILAFFSLRWEILVSHANRISIAFLDETACPGARGLSDEEKRILRRMRDFWEQPPLQYSW